MLIALKSRNNTANSKTWPRLSGCDNLNRRSQNSVEAEKFVWNRKALNDVKYGVCPCLIDEELAKRRDLSLLGLASSLHLKRFFCTYMYSGHKTHTL
jgi:hypothetical protein